MENIIHRVLSHRISVGVEETKGCTFSVGEPEAWRLRKLTEVTARIDC